MSEKILGGTEHNFPKGDLNMRVMFTELGAGWHESAEWHATLDPKD